MIKAEFETRLLENVHRRPFRPFVVNLTDGNRIVVKKPPVVYSDGAASFIDLEAEALVEFFHDNTRSIEPLRKEARA